MANLSQVLTFNELPKVLAVLAAEEGSYTYIDRLSHAPSKDLALMYVQEALRDLSTLRNLSEEAFENKKAFKELKFIHWLNLEKEVQALGRVRSARELREVLSLITAKALSLAAYLSMKEENKDREEQSKLSSGD